MSPHPIYLLRSAVTAVVWSLLAWYTAVGASLDEAYLAVVQIPSHGASGTIVATTSGETVVLTVAHAFEGNTSSRPVVLLVPQPEGAGAEKKAGIRLAAIDRRADLALLVLRSGPLAHAARIAPSGFAGPAGWGYSCGYDGMRLPATRALTRIQGSRGPTTYTQQPPKHGRSGGALLDADTGYLVGVVQGYTVEPVPVGLYASLGSIHTFLDRHGYGRVIGSAEAPDVGMPRSLPPAAGPGAFGRRVDPAPARPCPD